MSGINPANTNTSQSVSKAKENTINIIIQAAETAKNLGSSVIENYDLDENQKNFKYAIDLKVGQKIGQNKSLEYGYYSSDRTKDETNKLHLNTSIVKDDSIIYRVVLLDENGNVAERFTEENMKLEDLLEKYDKDKLVADVRDKNGNPQAWIKVDTLLDGVEKIPIEDQEEQKEIEPEIKEDPTPEPVVNKNNNQEEKLNWYEKAVNASKSITATRCSLNAGLVEGVGLFTEGVIDSLTMLAHHAGNMGIKAGLKVSGATDEEIKQILEERNSSVKDTVSKTYVKDFFDENVYQEDGFLTQNSSPSARKIGNIVGEAVPFVGVTVATGGAAAGAASSAATTAEASAIGVATASGVAAGATIGGETFLATYGKDAEKNFNNSMSYKDGTTKALVSSGIKSSIAAILSFAGEFVSVISKTSNIETSLSPIDDIPKPPTVTPSTNEVTSIGNVSPTVSPSLSRGTNIGNATTVSSSLGGGTNIENASTVSSKLGGETSMGDIPLFEEATTSSINSATSSFSTSSQSIPEIVNKLKNGGKIDIQFNSVTSLDDVVNFVKNDPAESTILEQFLNQVSQIISANRDNMLKKII